MFVGTSYTCLNIHKVLKRSLQLSFENLQLRRKAERTNAAKIQFLAAANHDLRQPIHALGLFFSALNDRIRDPDARPLVAQIDSTIGVIANMLDAGVARPNVGPVDLDELFARLRNELQATARQRGLSFRVRACGCRVRTDPTMLELILRNLLSNALRPAQAGTAGGAAPNPAQSDTPKPVVPLRSRIGHLARGTSNSPPTSRWARSIGPKHWTPFRDSR